MPKKNEVIPGRNPAPPGESSKSQASFDACINAQPAFLELNVTPAVPGPLVTTKDESGRTIRVEGLVPNTNCVFRNPA
jgi:hypothetical protein